MLYDEAGRPPPFGPIVQESGLAEDDVKRALRALDGGRPAHLNEVQTYASGQYSLCGVPTGHARRAAGSWPTAEAHASRLVAGIEAAAEEIDDEEEKGCIRKTASYLGTAGAPCRRGQRRGGASACRLARRPSRLTRGCLPGGAGPRRGRRAGLGVDLYRPGQVGAPQDAHMTRGWTSTSTNIVAQARRASWTVWERTPTFSRWADTFDCAHPSPLATDVPLSPSASRRCAAALGPDVLVPLIH